MAEGPSSVLIVTREQAGDRRYGIGRSLMPMVDALHVRGWRVRYLCREDLPQKAMVRYQVWLERLRRLPGINGRPARQQLVSALWERLFMGWFAARVAQADRYTTVHLHDPWLGCGFFVGVNLLRLRGMRWGVTEHGFGSYTRATHEDGLLQGAVAQRWLRRMEAWVLKRADFVTAPTRLALEQLARDLSMPGCPAHWHAIAHAAPMGSRWERGLARRQLGWAEDDLVVLGVGRLVPLKRFDLLVEACAQLARSQPHLRLVLLGEGDAQGLMAQASAAGWNGRLDCLAVDDVWPYYAGADIYASTSTTESFGLANFEALLSGLPCVCTAVGGVPEVMGSGAWLVPVELEAIVTALGALVNEPLQRLAWSRRALSRAGTALALDAMVDRYAGLYST